MAINARKTLDHGLTAFGMFSIIAVVAALVWLLTPIVYRGLGAYVFRATVEHRQVMVDLFQIGDPAAVAREVEATQAARAPVYDAIAAYEASLRRMSMFQRRDAEAELDEFKDAVRELLGPLPGDAEPPLPRNRYGANRWDQALTAHQAALFKREIVFDDPTALGREVKVPRRDRFADTPLEPAFNALENDLEAMLNPQWTFFWRFLTLASIDSHFFGGIWPEVVGTFYLTVGAILLAVPLGVLSAIYLTEYARDGLFVRAVRSCISTLAGVPSIVFGLFGLAFFINTIGVSESRSIRAGSLTLAVLILPVVIRAAEEALRAVPGSYREAALALGAGKWRTVMTVLLPAALPGVLTGVVISMGRAAGETAPIIFTAAVSAGAVVGLGSALAGTDGGTPALPWNIYNMALEHAEADKLVHVQYGMVFTLVALVLLLNGAAIVLRARIAKRLAG